MILKLLKSGYEKIKNALAKTQLFFGDKLRSLFNKKIDEETLEQLEQLLYEADLGVQTAQELTQKIREQHNKNPSLSTEEFIAILRNEILVVLKKYPPTLFSVTEEDKPLVLLVVGVNGNGKTTSVAKLAHRFVLEGKKVLIAAADTFRAAAIDQLEIWAKRLNVEIVKGNPGSDPAAVVFDALNAAKARGIDVVLIDTAGRLHTKAHLMQELEKIKRSCAKIFPNSPHETLLVLDATTGQNAVDQAKLFNKSTPISGLILTKLDGTAKGGIVVSILRELQIPVKFVGVGESVNDLEPFDAENFAQALFE